jgi:branched-chain amino acid transport system ATP-binding protein
VASHLQCLLEGRTTLEGTPSDVTAQQVEAAYFGLRTAPAGEGSGEALWSGSTTSSRGS